MVRSSPVPLVMSSFVVAARDLQTMKRTPIRAGMNIVELAGDSSALPVCPPKAGCLREWMAPHCFVAVVSALTMHCLCVQELLQMVRSRLDCTAVVVVDRRAESSLAAVKPPGSYVPETLPLLPRPSPCAPRSPDLPTSYLPTSRKYQQYFVLVDVQHRPNFSHRGPALLVTTPQRRTNVERTRTITSTQAFRRRTTSLRRHSSLCTAASRHPSTRHTRYAATDKICG